MGKAHHFVRGRRREDQAEQRSQEHRGDRAQHPVIEGGNLTEGAHQIRQLRGKIQLAGLQAQAQSSRQGRGDGDEKPDDRTQQHAQPVGPAGQQSQQKDPQQDPGEGIHDHVQNLNNVVVLPQVAHQQPPTDHRQSPYQGEPPGQQ